MKIQGWSEFWKLSFALLSLGLTFNILLPVLASKMQKLNPLFWAKLIGCWDWLKMAEIMKQEREKEREKERSKGNDFAMI